MGPNAVTIAGFAAYRIDRAGIVWTCWQRGGRGKKKVMGGTWRVKKPDTLHGHKRVELYVGDGTKRRFWVHHLVLIAFVGPRPDGMEACHDDGNPANNQAENLRWDTHHANMQDQIRHGTRPVGEAHARAKMTLAQAASVRSRVDGGETMTALAKEFGVSVTAVHYAYHRRNWRCLDG